MKKRTTYVAHLKGVDHPAAVVEFLYGYLWVGEKDGSCLGYLEGRQLTLLAEAILAHRKKQRRKRARRPSTGESR